MKGQKLHIESGSAERAASSVPVATAHSRGRDGATAEQVSDRKQAGAGVPGGMSRSLPADCESLEFVVITDK